MPVPDFTPYAGLLPSASDPATFSPRASELFTWFVETGAPQLAALAVFLDGIMEDEATVLDALDSLQASLGELAALDVSELVLDEDSFDTDSATRPPSQQSVGAYIGARSFAAPHLIISTTTTVWPQTGPGTDYQVTFDDVLDHDTDRIPGVSLSGGDIINLPPGEYYAEWDVSFYRDSSSSVGRALTTLRDMTAGVDLGHSNIASCASYGAASSLGRARFTLGATSTLRVVADIAYVHLDIVGVYNVFARPARGRTLWLWKLK